jgi:hypothetical protein
VKQKKIMFFNLTRIEILGAHSFLNQITQIGTSAGARTAGA